MYALQPLSLFLTVSQSLYLLESHICAAVCSRCDTNTQPLQLHAFWWAAVFSCFQCGNSDTRSLNWNAKIEVRYRVNETMILIYVFSCIFWFFMHLKVWFLWNIFQRWNCKRFLKIEAQRTLELHTIHSQHCRDQKLSKIPTFSGLTFYLLTITTQAFEISKNCCLSNWASIERTDSESHHLLEHFGYFYVLFCDEKIPIRMKMRIFGSIWEENVYSFDVNSSNTSSA